MNSTLALAPETQTSWGYRLSRNNWLIHVLVWAVLFLLPVLFSLSDPMDSPLRSLREWLPLSFSLLLFYLNYAYLIERFLFRSRYGAFLLINLATIAVSILLIYVGFNLINPLLERGLALRAPPPNFLLFIIFRNALSLALTIAAAIAIQSTRQWQKTQEREKRLRQEHLESELVNLKNQLNPHFFFNTLNNIYSLIELDPEQAQQVVYRLSKMMRYLLYDSNERYVSLAREMEFLTNYLDLMALRQSDHVRVRRCLTSDHPDLKIAPLLFISLIENAFKHGVSATEPSEIEVRVQVTESPPRQLVCVIRNTNFPKGDHDRSGSGIGLVNLEKRLQLLYDGHHALHYAVEGNYFEVRLTLDV
ncbi:Histidine kinase [Catalinimonas alkaloidigena]|uniref:Histidine kinase n=1 Tax=Catalinimonas alkaloidigena TaxID=1075417 RepID=A0A1G8X0N0_9BACT|nr:histidine kinase [Catalinimonas alkaloidigena]SDJ84199.1 Histidine kinase [Catalinimonas alkaloidigena]